MTSKSLARNVRESSGFERDAICGRAADRRRAAHDHVADRVGDAARGIETQIILAFRQRALIDHFQSAIDPAQSVER